MTRRKKSAGRRRARAAPIALDLGLLAQARHILGTRGTTDTIEAALHRVVEQAALDEELAWPASDPVPELGDRTFRAAAW